MVYVFLADGFEEVEAITVVDILRRSDIEIKMVGVGTMTPKGMNNVTVNADISVEEIKLDEDLKMIVLPGGLSGAATLQNSEDVTKCLEYASKRELYIAAICVAPVILGKNKILIGKKAVCFPGFEDTLVGAIVGKEDVVVDDNVITAKDMEVAMPFAKTLVDLLKG
ncbi:4-methyl-5(B-hydroxyethyl)-thiazole monophosphate biosynthesis protein [Clostridia bacterium]|nr:4-methyl-5(B-hydroxyethyl)-thiazole monophosphate biosynthesis protein [Clostridia bacterium]